MVIFGSPKYKKKQKNLPIHLGPLATNVNTQARNLGVIFDSELKCDKHTNIGSQFVIRLHIFTQILVVLKDGVSRTAAGLFQTGG